MHPLKLFPILLAPVSAIDIALHFCTWCQDYCFPFPGPCCSYLNYRNMGPNVCASTGRDADRFSSVSFNWIPKDWVIGTRAHGGGQCKNELELGVARNTDTYCFGHDDGKYSGGGYWFGVTKRGEAEKPQECTEHRMPSELVFGDGTQFNVEGMGVGLLGELIDIAKAPGANASAVPEKFHQFKV